MYEAIPFWNDWLCGCDGETSCKQHQPDTDPGGHTVTYIATINTPGYLPEGEPTEHDTARDAWEYLADERKRHEDDAVLTFGDDMQPGYSATTNLMESIANASLQPIEAGLDEDRTGTITGPTPGYRGDHDLGLAYSVTQTQEAT